MSAIIQTPTPNFDSSVNFYSRLGFNIETASAATYALGNKNLKIEINPDRFSRAGLKLFAAEWGNLLQKKGLLEIASKTENGYLLTAPSGCCLYLENGISPNLPGVDNNVVLGNFAGLSLETNQIEKSMEFWGHFGFSQNAGNIEQGWISLINNEGFGIGLMKYQCCPHLFFNPSLSFFNGKENLSIIGKVRALRIPITEEITHFNKEGIVDNIIIRDPGGLGYFLFND